MGSRDSREWPDRQDLQDQVRMMMTMMIMTMLMIMTRRSRGPAWGEGE